MKSVRYIPALMTIALLATFIGIAFFATAGPRNQTALAPGIKGSLDMVLSSPMTFMAGAPAANFAFDAAPSASEYSCTLISQTPADWTRMGRRQYFDAKWTVKNTGTKIWSTNGIDLKYLGGAKMHTYGGLYDLRANTGPNKKITLIVDMNAPKTNGYYTEYWGLTTGSRVFCRLSITVVVTH